MNLLLLCLLITNVKTIEAKYTEIPPKIDGFIEEIWYKGDSTYGFIQYQPSEGDSATEQTVVYILMDNKIFRGMPPENPRCITNTHFVQNQSHTILS